MRTPDIIPPRSVVRLKRSDGSTPAWSHEVGRRFRIGYYRPSDGLGCIWLVNHAGEYEQSTDRKTLLKFFEIEKVSSESDYFGAPRKALGAVRRSRKPSAASKAG